MNDPFVWLTVIVVIMTLGLVAFAIVFFCKVNKKERCADVSFDDSSKQGDNFVSMISAGRLKTVKTINHGNSFPDKKNLEHFKKCLSDDIISALNEVESKI